MVDFEKERYKAFEMFEKDWAIVAAGTAENHNGCTIGWGSVGTLWTRPGKSGSVMTVYVYPSRRTYEFLKNHDSFTVSFFDREYKKALGYMGSRSGRDEDKEKAAGLTPVAVGDSVGYKEAKKTFLCRKVYAGLFDKEGISPEIANYYNSKPEVYPKDQKGDMQTHGIFVGDIEAVFEKGEI